MSDFLLELGANPNARKLIQRIGLPIPLPRMLRRADGPREERPLHDQTVVFGATAVTALTQAVAETVVQAGAEPLIAGPEALRAAFADVGEAYGRPATVLDVDEPPEGLRPRALIFDASDITDTAALRGLYDYFHPLVRSLDGCGRIVVLGRPPAAQTRAVAAAAQAALEGFVRSLAKEIGKKGATAQLLYVEPGAETRLAGPLRFLLSARSAFVTGQRITVTATAADRGEPVWVRPLANKVALVTGAARGIGADTARLLAAEGAYVVCLDRPDDDAPLSKVAREINGSVLLADVTADDAPTRIADALAEEHGGVDIVVHNAGITRDKTLARMKPEYWDQAIDVNLSAVTRITAVLLERQLVRDGGRIICLSSVAGIAGNLGQANYAASKSGLIGYARNLAATLADKGITVNAIAPGFIETRLTSAIPVVIREVGRRLSSLAQGGEPRDVGEAITFLSTPAAQGITGSVVRVCGGAFIGA